MSLRGFVTPRTIKLHTSNLPPAPSGRTYTTEPGSDPTLFPPTAPRSRSSRQEGQRDTILVLQSRLKTCTSSPRTGVNPERSGGTSHLLTHDNIHPCLHRSGHRTYTFTKYLRWNDTLNFFFSCQQIQKLHGFRYAVFG